MSRSNQKTLKQSLEKDKWLLPLINLSIIIFGGFFVITNHVGFREAIGIYGFFVGVLLTLSFSSFAKNVLEWYNETAELGFHIWVFVILTCLFLVYFIFVPKKQVK